MSNHVECCGARFFPGERCDACGNTVNPPLTITIVPDSPCPDCGAAWGHPDPALDFCNRPKVGDADGTWWWKCYNPACPTDYYIPLL